VRDCSLIEQYLCELEAGLRLPHRVRRRIIGEARDHLEQLTEDAPVDGKAAAQAWATEAFGEPAVLARRFAEELAVGASRRAVRTGAAMLALFLILCDLCTSSFLNVPLGWVSDGHGTPLLWIVGQVGLVAGVVSLVRARIAARDDELDTVRLRYAARGLLVLAASAVITVAIACSGIATVLAAGSAHRGSVWLFAVWVLVCGVVTTVAASSTVTASRRLESIDDSPLTATGREAPMDMLAIAGDGCSYLARRVGLVARSGRITAAVSRVATAFRPFDPSEHPWRYASLVAVAAGCLVPILGFVVLVTKGQLNPSQVGDLALTAPALIAFEGTLVLLGYAAFGRYLGLRQTASCRSRRGPSA
jgi:hypothetical protein